MRFLVDSHILLWVQLEPEKLPSKARELLRAPENEFFFSAASIWELAIKARLQRVNFQASPSELARGAVESGFTEVPVWASVAARVATLPLHHRDPFDRLLIAQAQDMPARLLTVDKQLLVYSELVTLA